MKKNYFCKLSGKIKHTFINEKELSLIELSCDTLLFINKDGYNLKNNYYSRSLSLAKHINNKEYLFDRDLKDPQFFDIYFDSIHGENYHPTVWQADGLDFLSFHDCLIWHLLSHLLEKNGNSKAHNLQEVLEDNYSIFFESEPLSYFNDDLYTLTLSYQASRTSCESEVEEFKKDFNTNISKITKDKKVIDFINKIYSNLLEYRRYNFSSLDCNKIEKKGEERIRKNIEELFYILKGAADFILPTINGSGLEPYFLKHCEFFDKETYEEICDNISSAILYKTYTRVMNNFLRGSIEGNDSVRTYIKKNNIFYRVISFDKHCINSTNKIAIFPNNLNAELANEFEKIKKLEFNFLTIFNHHTQSEEEIKEPVSIWLEIDSLVKELDRQFAFDDEFLEEDADTINSYSEILHDFLNEEDNEEDLHFEIKDNSQNEETTNKKTQKSRRTLNRFIDAIIKRYAKQGGNKENHWNHIIYVINNNRQDRDNETIITFEGAEKYRFGTLIVSDDKLKIEWKGYSKKLKPTKPISYTREQFFDSHKKLLTKNGIF